MGRRPYRISICAIVRVPVKPDVNGKGKLHYLASRFFPSYGSDKMLALLNTFSQGSSYDGTLEEVYGFDMDGLNTLWRDWVTGQY